MEPPSDLAALTVLAARPAPGGKVRTAALRWGSGPLRVRDGTADAPLQIVFEPKAFEGADETRVPLKLQNLSAEFLDFIARLEAALITQGSVSKNFTSCLHQAGEHPVYLKARVDLSAVRFWDAQGKRRDAPATLRGAKVVAILWIARVYFSGASSGLTVEVPDMVVLDETANSEEPDVCPIAL